MNRNRLFLGCFVSLIATAFGFIVRALIIGDWKAQYGFTETEAGQIFGAGLAPFAISIILFSLVVDKIGYGRTMMFAFLCHVLSAYLTITADSYAGFYVATFIFALGNGAVEAVINPVVATVYDKQKTHWLNILHAGWPGGLVLGGVLTILMGRGDTFFGLPGLMWQWKVALVLLPTIVYGVLLLGVKFPVSERVAAGVSYKDMLKEFGTLSCFVVCFVLVMGLAQMLSVWNIQMSQFLVWGLIFGLTAVFHLQVRGLGQPVFVFLLLVMVPLAVTELGTDSWIADLMEQILKGGEGAREATQTGAWVLVYTSSIMFVLRFFAGPIVHRISPLGLLAASAAIAAVGLFWLSNATGIAMVFAAATCYGLGKTFFWPTTLGVVAERFPRGGALTLNSIAGVGMLSAGILGTPLIGYVQDTGLSSRLTKADSSQAAEYLTTKTWAFGEYQALNAAKFRDLEWRVAEPRRAVEEDEFQAALAQLDANKQRDYEPLAAAKRELAQAEKAQIDADLAAAADQKSDALRDAAEQARKQAASKRAEVVRLQRTEAGKIEEEVNAAVAKLRGAESYSEQFEAALAARVSDAAAYRRLVAERDAIDGVQRESKQAALGQIAILPAIMLACYLALIFYFRSKGGYQAEVLVGHAADDERFTGGVKGPIR
jgi:MFS family permease